jgi:hypothetical protein
MDGRPKYAVARNGLASLIHVVCIDQNQVLSVRYLDILEVSSS